VSTTIPDPYAHTEFRGKTGDWATVQALKEAESRLGYELTIYQFIGDAAASGDTHSKGRGVDLAPFDHARKVKVFRDIGFAAWYRPEVKGLWVAHVHIINIFPDRVSRKGVSESGFAQIGKYDKVQDGLAGFTPDPNPYRPKPVTQWSQTDYERSFNVPAQRPVVSHVSKARDAITEAHHGLGRAIVELQQTNSKRVAAKAQIPALRAARRSLVVILKVMPKK